MVVAVNAMGPKKQKGSLAQLERECEVLGRQGFDSLSYRQPWEANLEKALV